MKNSKNAILGLLIGVAFGAALGMLFAPHKGTITRRMIRKKGMGFAEDATDSIKESISELGESISEKFETVKKDIKARLSS